MNDSRSLSPSSNSDIGGSPPMQHMQASLSPSVTPSAGSNQPGDDEIIPTAIVIKNIPFNVKRETLLDIIVSIIPFTGTAEENPFWMPATLLYQCTDLVSLGFAVHTHSLRV